MSRLSDSFIPIAAISEHVRVLTAVSQALAEVSLDLGGVLQTLAREVSELIGDGCIVRLRSDDGRSLVPVAVHHSHPDVCAALTDLLAARARPVDEGMSGHVMRSQEAVLVPRVAEAHFRAAMPVDVAHLCDKLVVHSLVYVPLRGRNGTIGTLNAVRVRPDKPYTEDHVILLQDVANRAALAINNARLFEEAQLELQRRRSIEDELKRSNAELAGFASIASHDLQEPLRTMSGFAHLLEMGFAKELGDEGMEYVHYIQDASKRMKALIDDLLTYSRMGRGDVELQPVSMVDAVRAATSNLQAAIDQSQAQVTVGALPWVMGDSTRLVQLMQNLLSNAIKFSGSQPPSVTVHATRQEERWSFEVRDNGLGIAPRDHERIFQVFQRLHHHSEIPGTGIGLPLCARIVSAHGGSLTVQSELGAGAAFRFSLPACPEPDTTD